MNQRQQAFLQQTIGLANKLNEIYDLSFTLSQSFNEEFKSGLENSMDPVDGKITEHELNQYGVDYLDLFNVLNRAASQYVNFYTNLAVTQAEYGKFIRRIKTI